VAAQQVKDMDLPSLQGSPVFLIDNDVRLDFESCNFVILGQTSAGKAKAGIFSFR